MMEMMYDDVLWTRQDSFAIVWLLATAGKDPHRGGGHLRSRPMSLRTRSAVLQWHFFCESELRPFVAGLLRWEVDVRTTTRDVKFANKQRQQRLARSLDVLNAALRMPDGSARRFLVTPDRLSLADVCVAAAVLPVALNAATSASIRDVWTRKDLGYLKAWLWAGVARSHQFAAAARSFPDIFVRLEGVVDASAAAISKVDLNANAVADLQNGGRSDGSGRIKAAKKRDPQQGFRRRSAAAAGPGSSKAVAVAKELPPLPGKPFRILCLHGYRQNGNSFKGKLGAFRSLTAKYLDMTFITAPNHVLPLSADDINQVLRRGFFFRPDPGRID